MKAIRSDLRDGNDVEAMMEAMERQPPLDILVNNAAAFIVQSQRLSFCAADAILVSSF